MRENQHRKFALCASTALAICIGSPAMAQNTADPTQPGGDRTVKSATPDENTLGDTNEIIVTARRRQETAQDVPLVVNAVTSEAIQKLNIRDFREITTLVPGLQLTTNANGIGTTSSLRGINHDVNVSGENGTIQFYRNDAPTASSFVFQTLYDVGQIEVLRGPQGTLRGRSTPSGSITITTRRPDLEQPGGYLNGTFGSDDLKYINGAISVPIIRNILAVRIAGVYRFDRGNRVRSVNSTIEPYSNTEAIRATVRFEPVDWFRAGFLYEGLTNKDRRFTQVESTSLFNPAAVPSANAADYGTITPRDFRAIQRTPSFARQIFKFYNWNAEADVLGQRLIYVGSRTSQNYLSRGAGDAANFFPTLDVIGLATQTHGPFTSHEVRLQNIKRIAGIFDYVVGYFRYAGSSETVLSSQTIIQPRAGVGVPQVLPVGTPLGGPSIAVTPIYLPPGTPVEQSVFGNLTVHLGEATEISGGARRIHFTDFREGLFINCTKAQFQAGACVRQNGTHTDVKENHTIYNVSIKHRFGDNLMVYAATGTSWRPPVIAIGDFTNAPYTPLEVKHTTFGAETSKNYEAGFKSSWLGHKVLLNATAYHQTFRNYPFRAAGSGVQYINITSTGAPSIGSFNFISAVPVKINGLETELGFTPSSRFSLGATINYSKSKIGDAMLACVDALNNATGAVGHDQIPDVVTPTLAQMLQAYGSERLAECPGNGQRATFQPDWSGSIRAEANYPFATCAEAFVRGLLNWRGKSQNDPNNRFDDVRAYALLNLFAGVRDPRGTWELTIYAKNVFNTIELVTRNDTPVQTSVTDVFLAPPFFRTPTGTGSTNFTSRYTGITVTQPREFGVTFNLAFGSR
jgi:iron complex outermembrane receptor protein